MATLLHKHTKPSHHVSVPRLLLLVLLLYIWWFTTLIVGFTAYFIYTVYTTLLSNPLSLLYDSPKTVRYKKLAAQRIDIYSNSSRTLRNGIEEGMNGHSTGVNGSSSTLEFGSADNPYRVIIIGMQTLTI